MTYKTYTDVEQSKRLAGILPIESADMHYARIEDDDEMRDWEIYLSPIPKICALYVENLPCWSLSALLSVISIEHNLHGYLTEDGMVYRVETLYAGNSNSYDNPIDACVDMIEKLNEQKLL